jgi:hypothetical protein
VGFSVATMGPIETIAVDGNVTALVVLGQTFETSTDEVFGLAVGDYVVAAAHPGIGTTIYPVGTPYVAGVSTVKIKATVTALDASVGSASLGSTAVDYTATLSSNSAVLPLVDQPFEVIGTQPVAQGVILAGPSASAEVGCPALDGRM